MLVQELGSIFVFAGLFALIFKVLKQPLIPAFVLAGVFSGPLMLGLVSHAETVSELSEVAVVLMLFIIGTEMDLTRLQMVGPVAFIGGTMQVVSVFGLGFLTTTMLGYSHVTACYLGLILSFSSTMLAVKIMGEKRDLATLYGRISIGILVMQDVLAIFALSILATLNDFSVSSLLSTLTAASGLILIVVFIFGMYVLPKLFDKIAADREVLFVVTMSLMFVVAFYAVNQKLSLGIGSFLAGIAISRLSYRYEIIGDLKALKSFFTILFFAALGLQLCPESLLNGDQNKGAAFLQMIGENWQLIVILLAITLVIKPLVTMSVVAIFGYRKSPCFDVGLSLGQTSEFGLLLVASGIANKHIDPGLLPPVIIVTVISMTLSSYLMNFSPQLYKFFRGSFGWLEKLSCVSIKGDVPESNNGHNCPDVLLVGCDRLGRVIEAAIRKLGVKYLVVDSNPDIITLLRKEGVPCIFGDIVNHEVLEKIDFQGLRLIISAIPGRDDNQVLIEYAKRQNPSINFVGIVDSRGEAEALYSLGAHYVLVTYLLGAMQLLANKGERDANLSALLHGGEDVRRKGEKHRKSLTGAFADILALLEDQKSAITPTAEENA